MRSVLLERATLEHARALAPLMREADAAEVLAARGLSPLESLEESLRASDVAWTAFFDGEPAAMFGLVPVRETLLGEPGWVQIWALTGRAVARSPRTYLRASRAVVAKLLERHPVLGNVVDARYRGAVRWLRWLGAEVKPAERLGQNGELFHPFILRSPSWP